MTPHFNHFVKVVKIKPRRFELFLPLKGIQGKKLRLLTCTVGYTQLTHTEATHTSHARSDVSELQRYCIKLLSVPSCRETCFDLIV